MAVGTRMGNSEDCPRCERQVHTSGMIGGGWRVNGVGGPDHLQLVIQTRPSIRGPEGTKTLITIDRDGNVVSVGQDHRG